MDSILWFFIIFLLSVYLYRLFIQGTYFKKDTRMDGKVVIITGANSGIGKETAIDLAKRGAKVYMACRSAERGEESRLEVIEKSGNLDVHFRPLDLASMSSIREFAEKFLKEEALLPNSGVVLVNNAGIMACPKLLTADGFEMQLGTNHLGHFLLTNLLLDFMRKSAPSRVVNVSSMAHIIGKIYTEDLNSEKSYKPVKAYAQSKLANVIFTRELAKRVKGTGISTFSLHPGVINTELARHLGDSLSRFLSTSIVKPVSFVFHKTPRAGAQTTIMCAVDPQLEAFSGEYFSDCKLATATVNPLVLDDKLGSWLWQESERLTRVSTRL